MKDIIKNILTNNRERRVSKGLIARDCGLSLELDKTQAIIGPRRVGKTSALWLAMESLKKDRKIPAEQVVYFNFEDERVQFQSRQLDLLLQAWQELYPEATLDNAWFFFDEVQAAPGWERFLNRISETYSKKIFFTGSNSTMLHTEIKSVMRGRSIAVELLPLSFREYCVFAGVKTALYGMGKSKTLAAFYRYLSQGGYPETVGVKEPSVQTAYLQEYYNAMLLRDIIEYNRVSNYAHLRALYRQAAVTIGKTVSVRRLYNQLKAQHYHVGLNSVYDVMDMAERAYLFKRISRFDYSESKRQKSDRKIYWVDNGLLNANTAYYTGMQGLLLENAVFWTLYRRFGTIYNSNLYYYDDATAECDFIVYPEGGTPLPVQVCWSLSQYETRRRELRGLIKACAYCRVKEAWIVTAEEENEIEADGIKILVKPAWKWMLE